MDVKIRIRRTTEKKMKETTKRLIWSERFRLKALSSGSARELGR